MATVLETGEAENSTEKTSVPEQPELLEVVQTELDRYQFLPGEQGLSEQEIKETENYLAKVVEGKTLWPRVAREDMTEGMQLEIASQEQKDKNLKRVLPEHLLENDRQMEIKELARKIGRNELVIKHIFEEAEAKGDVRQLANMKAIGMRLIQNWHPDETGRPWNELGRDQRDALLLGQMMAQRTEAAMLNIKMREGKLKETVPVKNARQFAASFWKASQDQALPADHRQRLKEVARKLVDEYKDEAGFKVIIKDAAPRQAASAAAPRRPEPTATAPASQETPPPDSTPFLDQPTNTDQENTSASDQFELLQEKMRERRGSVDPYETAARGQLDQLRMRQPFGTVVNEGHVVAVLQQHGLANEQKEASRQKLLGVQANKYGVVRGLKWPRATGLLQKRNKEKWQQLLAIKKDAILMMRQAARDKRVDLPTRVFIDQLADEYELVNLQEENTWQKRFVPSGSKAATKNTEPLFSDRPRTSQQPNKKKRTAWAKEDINPPHAFPGKSEILSAEVFADKPQKKARPGAPAGYIEHQKPPAKPARPTQPHIGEKVSKKKKNSKKVI